MNRGACLAWRLSAGRPHPFRRCVGDTRGHLACGSRCPPVLGRASLLEIEGAGRGRVRPYPRPVPIAARGYRATIARIIFLDLHVRNRARAEKIAFNEAALQEWKIWNAVEESNLRQRACRRKLRRHLANRLVERSSQTGSAGRACLDGDGNFWLNFRPPESI
jgi:hypothetical protein